MTDRDELIEQARKISALGRNVPFPNAHDTQIAKAFVDAGWAPPPSGDVPGGAYVKIREMVRAYGDTSRIAAERIVEYIENMLRTPPQQDDPWGGASLAKCGDEACRCSREPTDD